MKHCYFAFVVLLLSLLYVSASRCHGLVCIVGLWHCRVDDGPTLNVGLVTLSFLGDPDQYCNESLYFCDFSGGGGGSGPPVFPPLRYAHATGV